MCFVSNHLKKFSIVVWYSDQYVIILRFFLYFKSATHFKILKFIHFFFSVRHRGEERTTRRFMLEDVARKMTLNTSVTDLKMPFTKLCRRWHIGPLQNYVDGIRTEFYFASFGNWTQKANQEVLPSSKYSQLLEKDSNLGLRYFGHNEGY